MGRTFKLCFHYSNPVLKTFFTLHLLTFPRPNVFLCTEMQRQLLQQHAHRVKNEVCGRGNTAIGSILNAGKCTT